MIFNTFKYLSRAFILYHNRNSLKNVNSWSPIALSFNGQSINNKIRLDFFEPDTRLVETNLQTPESINFLTEKVCEKVDKLLSECCSTRRNRKLVQIFDDLSDSICKVADLCEFIRMIHPSLEMNTAARNACIKMSNLVEKLNTNKPLYDCIKCVAEYGDTFIMTAEEKLVIDLFIFDFEQCGIHLPESDREKVVYYNDRILQCGQEFMYYASLARTVNKIAVPSTLLQYFNLSSKDEIIVHGYSDIEDEFSRESAYKIYLAAAPESEELLNEVLTYRHKLAEICGFSTYAHRALRGSTAETPEFVLQFLNTLNNELRDKVEVDFHLLRKKKASESKQELAMWDIPYYTAKIKREQLKLNAKEYRPFFSLGACMDGLNNLLNHLFSISLVEERIADTETWWKNIYKLAVKHETEGLLGYIYCDFYERMGKPNQDCHYTIQGGRNLPDGSYQNPIVVIVLNLPEPTNNVPSLLTSNMVENLFHEMGHAIHSMLGRAKYQHVTGTRCSTDFAEVPSVLMEYFASDRRVLKTFARHYKTGEIIPDEMLEGLCDIKNLLCASELQAQVFYSILDQLYHTNPSAPGHTTEILAEVQSNYYPVPYVPKTAWQLKFSHLIGYGAKYYSYLMSRAIASSIWDTCFKEDPFNRSAGEKYRRECLAHGGGKAPRLLIKDFLNKNVTPDEITKSLIEEIDVSYKKNCVNR